MTALEKGIEIFKGLRPSLTNDTEGWSIVEVGVYKGHSLTTLANAFPKGERLEDLGTLVYGFDSFEGLPHDWPGTVCKKGTFSLDGVIPQEPIDAGAEIFPGWFKDTIPVWAKSHKWPIGLLHLDADLYSSTATVLEGLNDHIRPGCVLVCDEWLYNFSTGNPQTDQEQQAVIDWAAQFNRSFVKLDYVDPTFDGWHVGAERAILLVTR